MKDGSPAETMRSALQRIATGPELSKDLSEAEAREAMGLVLHGKVDPVQTGVFLIALRMKRETDAENLGLLAALREASDSATAEVDELIDIAEPYDGCLRGLPAGPFLPAVLAACGLPAVSHGVESVGPKFGVTHRQVLRAAGAPVDLSLASAASRIADPALGWAYVDQRTFCPALHDLVTLRALIVKRPALSTLETLIGPVRARGRTRLLTGYVHKAYPRVYAMLARASGFDSALIVRGTEGGVIPSLSQPANVYFYHARGPEEHTQIDPAALGIVRDTRAVPLPPGVSADTETIDHPDLAAAAVEAGTAALQGEAGPTFDALSYAAALALWHAGRHADLREAAETVRAVLRSGEAYRRFTAAGDCG